MAAIAELLEQATRALVDSASAARDAEILLCHVLACERAYLYTWPEKTLDAALEKRFLELIEARSAGTPVAYITGVREFWSLPFLVSADTLIPRPETELLVEYVLNNFTDDGLELLDLGTGSGAIAIALAHSRPQWQITASDISAACLDIAARNAVRNQVRNVQFLHSDWCDQLGARRFDLVVSNPPYIAEQDPHLTRGDLRFEPHGALCATEDGLAAIVQLCQQVKHILKPGGWFFTEHGYSQKAAVLACFQQQGFGNIVQLDDLGDQPRISGGQLNTF